MGVLQAVFGWLINVIYTPVSLNGFQKIQTGYDFHFYQIIAAERSSHITNTL